ncbi:hypothetical protein BD311DRAFT_767305 [Dichomitus squalens]|uniref:Uncharacterized protein n=1 Tax=Dichomitus squalens TaxID=114155 RepID=A0A4Q9MAD5_9APHY|nr:hypothetical protein BD311DRAFT_767305 [Dichomitus squalens]
MRFAVRDAHVKRTRWVSPVHSVSRCPISRLASCLSILHILYVPLPLHLCELPSAFFMCTLAISCPVCAYLIIGDDVERHEFRSNLDFPLL